MKIFLYILWGLILGVFIGVLIPYFMVQAAYEESGDKTVAGGMFLIFLTVPLCTVFGGIFGGLFGCSITAIQANAKPFSKREVFKTFNQYFSKKELKVYYSGIRLGYDSNESQNAEGSILKMGLFDGAKIKAYGTTEKIFKERINFLTSSKNQ
ncbi:MAG: hypothetical protein NE328_11155 [Lentisphaeraceae bacterium]|nr:hypothetical protein [Lentisphaeraceae bacterium]